MSRYVVTVNRTDFDPGVGAWSTDVVVVGPFRSRERAEQRAATIRRLADHYEDPEGVTGPDNALSVVVEPLTSGGVSAERALDLLYGSVVA